ncbi:MAG: hypothetical protein INH41_19825 [Myxococcaceae bacterium]|jgi:hypothetical protein|nr:hypothetical protein [Myxococcaceae bacterium]MCA3014637.1 hypothetical protein [Myxococcaceae bacterium]
MPLTPFIHVRAAKFGVLPGEADELVNEGMYGKALGLYLVEALRQRGYDAAGPLCEDWGWWVGLGGFPFSFGVTIYGAEREGGGLDLYVSDGATDETRFSWRHFKRVDTGARSAAERLHADLVALFQQDGDVEVVSTTLRAPFSDGP